MAPAAGALAAAVDVEHDVVVARRPVDASRDVVQHQRVRARFHAMLWSAHEVSPLTPTAPMTWPAGVVQRQPAAEHVHSADPLPEHEVAGRAVVVGVAAVRDVGVDRVALLQAEEAPARLNRAVEVRGGKRQAVAG